MSRKERRRQRSREKIVVHAEGCWLGADRKQRFDELPLPRGRKDVGAALASLKGDTNLCRVAVIRLITPGGEGDRIVTYWRPSGKHPWRRERIGKPYYRLGE